MVRVQCVGHMSWHLNVKRSKPLDSIGNENFGSPPMFEEIWHGLCYLKCVAHEVPGTLDQKVQNLFSNYTYTPFTTSPSRPQSAQQRPSSELWCSSKLSCFEQRLTLCSPWSNFGQEGLCTCPPCLHDEGMHRMPMLWWETSWVISIFTSVIYILLGHS